MGRKNDKKSKKRVVLSLAEFNENAGLGGADPELAALPSAPKAPEQWEAEGGRPEYNSRGYKERSSGPRERRNRGDGDDEDWSRRGPLDDDSGFGGSTGERDWAATRREQPASEEASERDWNDIKRGPVEASFSGPSSDRSWFPRTGPVDADVRPQPSEADWASVRRNNGAIEAEFSRPPDLSQRRPVEASENSSTRADSDWFARKGPVEAQFTSSNAGPDWSARKGPIEVEPQHNWTDLRNRTPVDSNSPQKDINWSATRQSPLDTDGKGDNTESRPDVDWSLPRNPVQSKAEMASQRAKERELDFDNVRGSKFLGTSDSDGPTVRGNWRRDSNGSNFSGSGRASRGSLSRPKSNNRNGTDQERDWSTARRNQRDLDVPGSQLASNDAENRMKDEEGLLAAQTLVDVEDGMPASENVVETGADVNLEDSVNQDDDEWTTVRANPKKYSHQARRLPSGSASVSSASGPPSDRSPWRNKRWQGREGADLSGAGGFGSKPWRKQSFDDSTRRGESRMNSEQFSRRPTSDFIVEEKTHTLSTQISSATSGP